MRPTCRGPRGPPASAMRPSWSASDPTCPSSGRSAMRTRPAACATLLAPPAVPRLHLDGLPLSRLQPPSRSAPLLHLVPPSHQAIKWQAPEINEGCRGGQLVFPVPFASTAPRVHCALSRLSFGDIVYAGLGTVMCVRACMYACIWEYALSHLCEHAGVRIHLCIHGEWGWAGLLKFTDNDSQCSLPPSFI